MSLLPNSRLGKIEFYEAHVAPWQTNAVAIGLTVQQVIALVGFTKKARDAYNAHQAAMEAAKAATLHFYNCVGDLADDGADLIRTIRNQAETEGGPNVYVLAQIPAPSPHSPTPPPGLPTDLHVELLATGALTLSWKCPNPAGTSGTIYEVQRRVGGPNATFVYIGASGLKSFTDDTLPAGSASVTYQITAVRSTARGNPARFTINFGVGGEGPQVASMAPAGAPVDFLNVEIPASSTKGTTTRRNGHAVTLGR